MSMRGAVAGCVVLVCLVALLAERTEGHITFFSPKEMMLMKEREGKMEPRSEDDTPDVTAPPLPPVEQPENPEVTVVIDSDPSPQQQDHVARVIREILHELAKEHQKAK